MLSELKTKNLLQNKTERRKEQDRDGAEQREQDSLTPTKNGNEARPGIECADVAAEKQHTQQKASQMPRGGTDSRLCRKYPKHDIQTDKD